MLLSLFIQAFDAYLKPLTQKTLFDHFPKNKPQTSVGESTAALEKLTPLSPDTPSLIRRANSGSLDDPIIIDESPAKPNNAFYPIFNSDKLSRVTSTPLKLTPSDAPFPDSESQHVRGHLHTFPLSQVSFQQRRNGPADIRQDISNSTFNSMALDTVPTAEPVSPTSCSAADIERCLQSIPIEHRQSHSAISTFISATSHPPSSTNQVWAEKWRPAQAAHVLGNESQATYLRDWLKALQVQFSSDVPLAAQPKAKSDKKSLKRSRVIRAVAKPRGRKKQRVDSEDENDWIVNSDDGVDEDGDSEDEYLPVYTSLPSFDHYLTNTIVLTGPTGCGKTAAVYACAEELGWEVFEVYPGIGKRSGASVDNLVGEVGKNHLVRATQSRGHSHSKDRNAFAALLRGEYHDARDQQAHVGLSPSSEFGFVEQSRSEQAVRQSLILLEEVDILYKEDINFWSSVVSLIRECKRPVICTCNGDACPMFFKMP